MNMDVLQEGEITEYQQRIKVLKAKLRSKQKAIVKASIKAQRETTDRTTIVKAHQLIGQLKLKVITMQKEIMKFRASQSPSQRSLSSHSKIDHILMMGPNDEDEMQKTIVLKGGQRLSPLRLDRLKAPIDKQPSDEALQSNSVDRLNDKQNTLIKAMDSQEEVMPHIDKAMSLQKDLHPDEQLIFQQNKD